MSTDKHKKKTLENIWQSLVNDRIPNFSWAKALLTAKSVLLEAKNLGDWKPTGATERISRNPIFLAEQLSTFLAEQSSIFVAEQLSMVFAEQWSFWISLNPILNILKPNISCRRTNPFSAQCDCYFSHFVPTPGWGGKNKPWRISQTRRQQVN